MPLYEYECQACHRRIEKIQKFSDAELTVCPHCGGALERTITAPAFNFAGGGWYKDLYSSAKPAGGGDSGGDSGSGDSKGKSDSGSGDSAGAATPAATPAASSPAPASAPAAAPSAAPAASKT